jgi:vanillate O-demethylase ferredoxin subunit
VRREATDIVSVDFAVEEGMPVRATPGAHLRLALGDRLVRQYTLCNGPDDGSFYRVAVKREPASRGGSAAIHALRPGDRVVSEGPFNQFEVDWSHRHLVLVAAGIGITPILSMALHAAARGHEYEVHYFCQSEDHAAFRARLEQAAGSRLSMHIGLDPDSVSERLRSVLTGRPQGSGLYVCGPTRFMDLARDIGGRSDGIVAVHFESFGSGESATSQAGRERDCEVPFRVRLARTGIEYEVPADRSILEVLESEGMDVLCSCRGGVCGMCVTEVLEGEPDHRDEFLSEASKAEGQLMTICVSRSKRPMLVLDL